MIILKKTADDFLNFIKLYIESFEEKARKKVLTNNLEKLIFNFHSKVKYDTIYIECIESKIESLLIEYITMLSKKRHIISFVCVDRQNSVYVVKTLEKIKELSETYRIMPTKIEDNKIRIFLAFYSKDYSQRFDVDLATKLLL